MESLFNEPDIPMKIFFLISLEDLLQVELVSNKWREFIIFQSIWSRKLEINYANSILWKTLLNQHGWRLITSTHINSKRLFLKLTVLLGPDEISNPIQECIQKDTPIDLTIDCSSTYSGLSWEAKHFLAQRMRDYQFLMSPIVSWAVRENHTSIYQALSITRKFNASHGDAFYSSLILLNPLAFPILVTEFGHVLVAGVRYGKGKVIVVGHEAALAYEDLIRLGADWCANKTNCDITVDPSVRKLAFRKSYPFPNCDVTRENVTSKVQVYLTHGHDEKHADNIMNYVKNGGGLIIGGNVWWQYQSTKNSNCYMLDFPGNVLIARTGVVFSQMRIPEKVATMFQIDRVPALKYSLYYNLKYLTSRSGSSFEENWIEKPHRAYMKEIKQFEDVLQSHDFFDIILEIWKNWSPVS